MTDPNAGETKAERCARKGHQVKFTSYGKCIMCGEQVTEDYYDPIILSVVDRRSARLGDPDE